MPLIDTLALKTGLLDGGMPEPQAAAIVTALADADTCQLATKADLEGLRADVRTEIEALQAEVTVKIEALRGDFKALNGKVNRLLAFNTPLLFAVLALLWRTFFATPE